MGFQGGRRQGAVAIEMFRWGNEFRRGPNGGDLPVIAPEACDVWLVAFDEGGWWRIGLSARRSRLGWGWWWSGNAWRLLRWKKKKCLQLGVFYSIEKSWRRYSDCLMLKVLLEFWEWAEQEAILVRKGGEKKQSSLLSSSQIGFAHQNDIRPHPSTTGGQWTSIKRTLPSRKAGFTKSAQTISH